MTILLKNQIEELRKYDTPTITNAIEFFGLRTKIEGFMNPNIKCILPYGKTMIGYACTAKVSSMAPANTDQSNIWMEYYSKLLSTPRPSVALIQDVDANPIGSFWGEVNATVHKSLGCVGTITNGGVRDLDEVAALGFGFFASWLLVSHAYIHIEAIDCPVTIGGLTVNPGDLLAADKHGVVLIPEEIASRLSDACIKAGEAELPVLNGCRRAIAEGKDVDLVELRQWRKEMAHLRSLK